MNTTPEAAVGLGARDRRLLIDIEGLCKGDHPSVDSPEAHVSVLSAGLEGIGNRIRSTPPVDRDAIARIIDDEIWDGDGDYPLERTRIATRREAAYARADRIVAMLMER